MKKLIIKESQYNMLRLLTEGDDAYKSAIKEVVGLLNKSYKRVLETYRDGNEYKQRKAFEIIHDGSIASPGDVLKYLKGSFRYNPEFLKQVMIDWENDSIKEDVGLLSKNVPLYK